MGLTQLNFEGKNRVEVALERLRGFEPPEGYHLAFSGGKDSVVLYDLAVKAGIKFDAHYCVTGIDPPELVRFIRQNYPNLIWDRPLMPIFRLIEEKGLPNRMARFCCEYLKEHSGAGRLVLTGVRWAESVRRKKRKMIETCRWQKGKSYLHPIIDWSHSDVWDYIHQQNLPYCSLYDKGFKRLGCVLCPMASARQTKRDMERWPKLAEAWYRATERYFARSTVGVQRWSSAKEMFEWWLTRKGFKDQEEDCQLPMFV